MLLERNLKPVYICNFLGKLSVQDSDGYYTGEKTLSYSEPFMVYANVSPAKSDVVSEKFGIFEDYDKLLVLPFDTDISSSSVLFVDKEPEFDLNNFPLYDYTVSRVSKSVHVLKVYLKASL